MFLETRECGSISESGYNSPTGSCSRNSLDELITHKSKCIHFLFSASLLLTLSSSDGRPSDVLECFRGVVSGKRFFFTSAARSIARATGRQEIRISCYPMSGNQSNSSFDALSVVMRFIIDIIIIILIISAFVLNLFNFETHADNDKTRQSSVSR